MTQAVGPPAPTFDVVPPVSAPTVFRTLAAAAVAVGVAAALGLTGEGGPSAVSSVRLVLVAGGALAAAVALTQRSDDWRAWAAAGGIGWLAVAGLPAHWDTGRLVAGVLGTLGLAGAGLAFAPAGWRYAVLSLFVLYHFGSLLTHTTLPETYSSPPPWVSTQAANRLYSDYSRFLYLINAYHFYSPDPGPASHLFLYIEYQTDEDDKDEKTGEVKRTADGRPVKVKTAEWVNMPQRTTQYRDPLGMTYYRRLSLTELVSQAPPGGVTGASVEKANAVQRRRDNQLGLLGVPVPGAVGYGNEIDLSQYRVPLPHIRRQLFPSYARHVARVYTGPRKRADGTTVQYTVTRVKMFRVEHRVLSPNQFLGYDNPLDVQYHPGQPPRKMGLLSPYHPSTYHPYYVGEYDPDGELTNPNDPLLYWLLPVEYVPAAGRDQKSWQDYMSRYATGNDKAFFFQWEGKE
jgi:hypothetical protein